ncbi:hypothetical protein VZT92_008893 [Zoarces viviparus]|uniref:peptide-methionine (S)-S-oxide reductase n=1 Tax=Zoarces viviparus TaxID=48416 RepID=A0AAW1FG77_ZOAVI
MDAKKRSGLYTLKSTGVMAAVGPSNQGMRQQNDRGTPYRSAIYTSNPTQQELALKSKVAFQQELDKKGYGSITTEVREGQLFYYAEDDHQQYLKKVPNGYCKLKGTGVSCPIGARKDEL